MPAASREHILIVAWLTAHRISLGSLRTTCMEQHHPLVVLLSSVGRCLRLASAPTRSILLLRHLCRGLTPRMRICQLHRLERSWPEVMVGIAHCPVILRQYSRPVGAPSRTRLIACDVIPIYQLLLIILIGNITGLVCPSICPSICPIWTFNLKSKR